MMRSAGSRGGEPGKNAEAISTSGGIAANRMPGNVTRRPNHASGDDANCKRLRATSVAISQAEIGDTYTPAPEPCAAPMAARLCAVIGSPLTSQIAAQVSSRIAGGAGSGISQPRLAGSSRQVGAGGNRDAPAQRAPEIRQ